jgi:acyl carrier protein
LIENELVDYISKEIAYDRTEALKPDAQLLDGALDSVDVLRLVTFLEERYSVTIEDDELLPENFATVKALADLLRRKGIS